VPLYPTILANAVTLWELDFTVLPIVPGQKNPVGVWKKYQTERASLEQLNSWWANDTANGLGIITGISSRDVVLDFDPTPPHTVDNLIAEAEAHFSKLLNEPFTFPQTCRVSTSGGAYHDHYHCAKSIRTKQIFEGKCGHIELRGDGSIAVMPPTISYSKRTGCQGTYSYLTDMSQRISGEGTQLEAVYSLLTVTKKQDNLPSLNEPTAEEIRKAAQQYTNKLSEEAKEVLLGNVPPTDRSAQCYYLACELVRSGIRDRRDLATLLISHIWHTAKYATAERQNSEWGNWGHACKLADKVLEEVAPKQDILVEELSTKYRTIKLSDVPAQEPKFLVNPYLPRGEITLFDGDSGDGKALALDTVIPTPNGFTTMGALKVGDTVFDGTGNPTLVTYISPVKYGRTCYKVCFDDESEVIADAEHLWKVQTVLQRCNTRRWLANPKKPAPNRIAGHSVLTTKALIPNVIDKDGKKNYSIDIVPAYGKHQDLPISPYVLGAWLGDGTAVYAEITNPDVEILQNIIAKGFNVTKSYSNGDKIRLTRGINCKGIPAELRGVAKETSLSAALRRNNLLNNKHIPQVYLHSSFEQRLALLQGLMDTDGSVSPRGQCEFTSTKAALAEQVRILINSLGIKCTLKAGIAKGFGIVTTRYRLTFTTTLPVFRLSRKKERLPKKTSVVTRRRYITAIEEVPSVPVKCITVEAPEHTYLCTDKYIVTHNTFVILALIAGLTGSKICPVPYDNTAPKNCKILILTTEDDLGGLSARLDLLGANKNCVTVISSTPEDGDYRDVQGVTAKELPHVKELILRMKPDLIIIDPITLYATGDEKYDSDKGVKVRGMLNEIKTITRQTDCATVIVRHFRKQTADRAIHRGVGSVDHVATSRSVLVLGKHPDNPTIRCIAHAKCNLAPTGPSLMFTLQPGCDPPFQWVGTSMDVTADNITAEPRQNNGEDKDVARSAEEFLLEELARGKVLTGEIFKAAKTAHISEAALKKAKSALGIRARKYGKDWYMELPNINEEGEN